MKTLFRYISYVILGLIVVLLLFGMFSQTPIFKNWLKNRVIALVESETDFGISVGKLRGNLLNYIQFRDIIIESDNRPLFRADAIVLQYAPVALLSRRIILRQLTLDSTEVTLSQNDQGVWNITELAGDDGEESDEPSFLEKWEIQAPRIEFKSGKVHIEQMAGDQAWSLPQEIGNVDLKVGFWAFRENIKLLLTGLSFEIAEPDFTARSETTNLEYESGNLRLQNLEVHSNASKIQTRGAIENFDNPEFEIHIGAEPLSLAELSHFFSALPLREDVQFTIDAKGKPDDLELKGELGLGQSQLEVSGTVAVRDEPFRYDLSGRVSRLDLAKILQDSTQRSDLNFGFNVKGSGLQWRNIYGDATIQLDSSAYAGYRLPPADLSVRANGDTLDYDLVFEKENARADLAGSVIATPNLMKHALTGNISHVNLNPYIADKNLDTDINVTFRLTGSQSGTDVNSLTADLKMVGLPSRVAGVAMDSSKVHLTLSDGVVKIEELGVNSPVAVLHGSGQFAFSGLSDINITADLKDVTALAPYVPLDSLVGTGKIVAGLKGDVDSLQFDADVALSQFGYADGIVGMLDAQVQGKLHGSDLTFDARGHATELAVFDQAVDSVAFHVAGADSIYNFDFHALGDAEVSLDADGRLIRRPHMQELRLESVAIGTPGQRWKNVQTARIRLIESTIEIDNLAMVADSQIVSVSGNFDPEGQNSLRLQVEEMRLGRFLRQFDQSVDLTGRLNFHVEMAGTLNEPRVSVTGDIRELQYLQIPTSHVSLSAGYTANSFDWQADLSTADIPKLLESSGQLPGELSLSPFALQLDRQAPIVFKFNSRGIDISIFDPFMKGVRDIRGQLTADILVTNTLEDLSGKGTVRVIDGEFAIPELGTKYRNFSLALDLDGRSVRITDFRVRSGSGSMNFVEGSLSLSRDRTGVFKSVFRLRNFEVMNNKKMRARATGEVELAGSVQSPRFSGDLDIDEASINYEKWLEEETVLLTSHPFFVMTPDTIGFDSTGALRFQKQVTTEGLFTESEFYKALRGQLSVEFLRNSWIRSRDTNIEINGEITVVKESPDFVLQGNVATARGFYTLLGNRFQIERGNIFFDGDPDLNADVDIVAIYRFVDQTAADPKPHAFKVFITGKLYEPEFQFTLDDAVASQEDIISILLFGQRSGNSQFAADESLNDGNNDQLSQAARGILTTQTLNMLGQRLGEEFRLDVIQIESGKDWKDSRVRIGKYLTPEVFVSLSQPFGSEGNQKVELEYAIPRKILFFHLLLQAVVEEQGDSGADVIWKIEW